MEKSTKIIVYCKVQNLIIFYFTNIKNSKDGSWAKDKISLQNNQSQEKQPTEDIK